MGHIRPPPHLGNTQSGESRREAVRKVVDWDRLREVVKGIKEGELSEEERWYDELPGISTYEKLKSLRLQNL